MALPKIETILEITDQNRATIVPCLIGPPGIGKTQKIYRWCEDHGRNCVEIIASQILPNEVSGITMPIEGTQSMEVFDHARMSSLKDGDVLFFDELFEADKSVLSACLTLIESRKMMSGRKLPDIMIVAATNMTLKPSQLSLAVRQRFLFMNLKFNASEWSEYIKEKHGVIPTKKLIDMLHLSETDDMCFNSLTPRSADKLIGMYLAAPEELERTVSLIIEECFDFSVREEIVYTCNSPIVPNSDVAKGIVNLFEECFGNETDISTTQIKDPDELLDYIQFILGDDEFQKFIDMVKEKGEADNA